MGLRAHWLQHVPFEGLGSIEAWLLKNRATVSVTRFFERAALPGLDEFDLLVIMGGPMSVNDERAHSWLKEEKAFAAKAIDAGKAVLGVCLGAQLIASALGARVRRNAFPEIGWFPLESMTDSAAQGILGALPGRFEAFHWHGETFDLPDKATYASIRADPQVRVEVFGITRPRRQSRGFLEKLTGPNREEDEQSRSRGPEEFAARQRSCSEFRVFVQSILSAHRARSFATSSIACTMRRWLPQRHRLSSMYFRISSTPGSGVFCSSAYAFRIMPDVQ